MSSFSPMDFSKPLAWFGSTTIRADVPPTTTTAKSGERIKSTALGTVVPIVLGTGRVDGIFVLGGTRVISTTEYRTETETSVVRVPIWLAPPDLFKKYSVKQHVDGEPYTIATMTDVTITKEYTVPYTTTETVALVGYVLAFDALKTGYDLIRLEVDGKVVFDTENAVGQDYAVKFYGGRQTTIDQITSDIIGDNAGAYQNYVMVFLEGYPAGSPPSISAVISNAATDQPEDQQIEWTGTVPLEIFENTGSKVAYDPSLGVMYQLLTQLEIPSLTRVVLVVLDVDTESESYRVDLEDSENYAVRQLLGIMALRGSSYIVVELARVGFPNYHRIYDTSTGKIVAEREAAGDESIEWFLGLRFDSTKYVLVGYDHRTTPVGDEKTAYGIVDITAGTITVDYISETDGWGNVSYGRALSGSISFFFHTAAGEVSEATFDGDTWSVAVAYTSSSNNIAGMWFDPLTGYLVISEYTGTEFRIVYVNPDNGAVLNTIDTDPVFYSIPNGFFGKGRERFWPRPGYALFVDGTTIDGIALLDIQAGTFSSYAPSLSETDQDIGIFDQNRLFFITGATDDVWTIHYLPNSVPGLIDLEDVITDVMSLARFGPDDLTFEGFPDA